MKPNKNAQLLWSFNAMVFIITSIKPNCIRKTLMFSVHFEWREGFSLLSSSRLLEFIPFSGDFVMRAIEYISKSNTRSLLVAWTLFVVHRGLYSRKSQIYVSNLHLWNEKNANNVIYLDVQNKIKERAVIYFLWGSSNKKVTHVLYRFKHTRSLRLQFKCNCF